MMSWTAQRMDLLRTMWAEGRSSTQISEALGGVSRNAVMGKVNRMGLMRSALHNMRMPRMPFGACRAAMLRMAISQKKNASARSDATVEEVVPVPAFFVSDFEVVDPVTSAAVLPVEDAAPVDVLDAIASDAVAPPSAPSAVPTTLLSVEDEVSGPLESPPAIDSLALLSSSQDTGQTAAVLQAPVDVEAIAQDPVDEVVELAPVAEPKPASEPGPAAESKFAIGPRSRLSRTSRSWRGSPSYSTPKEPASFSIPPKGLMGRVRAAAGSVGEVDAGVAVSFVKEMGGGIYDATRRAHQAALVAVATVLARGDPRRILVPFMPEPHVLQMMRGLAEKAIVVGGKPPERWADDETGDKAFFDDVISVEGPLRMDVAGYRRAA